MLKQRNVSKFWLSSRCFWFEAVNADAAVCTMLPRMLAVLIVWGLKTPVFAGPEAGFACS